MVSNVGVHLKGEGSFRALTEKPSLAIKFDQFVEKQTYHGLKKLMFNNSVQDRAYLSELLATQLFRDAGVPAARVTHARMRLNGRDLGLYVVIEAMNKDFLKRHFGSGKGNLYEGFLQDVHGRLDQDHGDDPSKADLQALCDACAVPDPTARWEQLNNVLDVDRFASFIAMEMLATHWDGYAIHFNNYRLYHDPETDKMVFITHGLDSAFRRPNVSLAPPLKSLVVTAVLTTPGGRKLYEERVTALAREVFKVPVILARMDEALGKIRRLKSKSINFPQIERHARVMRERIEVRGLRIEEQLRGVKPEPLKFGDTGLASLVSWRDEPDRGEPLFDRPKHDGKNTLHIRANRESTRASWRSQVFLEPGSYRFEGSARTALTSGSARLRISGDSNRGIGGSGPWQRLGHNFTVEGEGMDIEFVCELNAREGDVWFDVDSLRVQRLGDVGKQPATSLQLLEQ